MAEITAQQAYAGGVKNKLGQESLGRLSTDDPKKKFHVEVRCTIDGTHDEVYDQKGDSFAKGGNACPACNKQSGYLRTLRYVRPDLMHRVVDDACGDIMTSSDRNKIEVRCSEDISGIPGHPDVTYVQGIRYFARGKNGCPYCGPLGTIRSIEHNRSDMAQRLVNRGMDGALPVNSTKKVSFFCDNGHPRVEYKKSVQHVSVSPTYCCPECKHGGVSSSFASRRPDLLGRIVRVEDRVLSSESNKDILVSCDNGHDYIEYYQVAQSFSRGNNGCKICGKRRGTTIEDERPNLTPLLVDPADRDTPSGSSRKLSLVCDGTVYGTPHSNTVEYSQSASGLVLGYIGCYMCAPMGTKNGRTNKTHYVLSGIIDHIENLSGAQKMALVLRRHGIKPGSPVGQAILKNDVPGLKEIMEGLGAEDKDESELADLVSSGSDEEDFLVPDADVEDSMSDEDLPSVSTKEGFAALEALSEISIGSDESAVRFLVDSAVHRLWQMLYAAGDVQAYVREVREKLDDCSNDYMCEFLGEFLRQYDEASALDVPERWGFYEPNLMQKHMALLVGERKLVGNWSGTGAGKTASAILSAMVGDREHILVVCPNNTVKGWKESIEVCDPDAEVLTKTFTPKWSNESGSKWLVVNFDKFSGNEESALKMMQDVEFDMLVIDELHWVKERGGTQVSQRRETLRRVRSEMPEDSFVLGMSATPVVNDLSEGRSLIGLIDGRDPDFDTRPNLNNVQALHENMVRVGFRAIIPPKVGFDGEEFIDVDITHVKDELLVPGISHVTVDAIVAMEFAETIADIAKKAKDRGKGVMVYTEYLTGIDEPLTEYLRGEGLKVAHFTGSHEKADIGSLVGNFDVLIGTQAIGTGVDGVQKWADTVVYATLPWTSAQFEQSRARVYRQGSTAETVRVVIPRGVVRLDDDKEWSWTDARWNRIKSKKDLASAAVDGEFPEHVVSSPKEATTAALAMLERMDSNDGE